MKQVLVAWGAQSLCSFLSLLLNSSGICQIHYYYKIWWGTRALNSSFARSVFCFILYCMLKNLVASVENQSFKTGFQWMGFCFVSVFLLQFLAILTVLANTNKIYFGLFFPCVFASQMCYRNSCLIVVQYLKISLNAELELFSVSLNYWSNLVWDPE